MFHTCVPFYSSAMFPTSAVLEVRQHYVAGDLVDGVMKLVYMIGHKICQINFTQFGICHGGSYESSNSYPRIFRAPFGFISKAGFGNIPADALIPYVAQEKVGTGEKPKTGPPVQ